MKSRVLVCGGREFRDLAAMTAVLNPLRAFFSPDFVLIHGAARGADMTAHTWAFFQGCPVISMPANWDKYGKAAGVIRNSWMLKYAEPDLVIAFPGGVGTADMIRQAKEKGIDIYEV